ncbi:amino acid adenylation domain-containing protein [Peribacillus simplex]|uniref:amino acid adenylation domain-containing protein n=1 Tax=Peribacillus simplex TaxID=1478 RepID=UPI003D2984A2
MDNFSKDFQNLLKKIDGIEDVEVLIKEKEGYISPIHMEKNIFHPSIKKVKKTNNKTPEHKVSIISLPLAISHGKDLNINVKVTLLDLFERTVKENGSNGITFVKDNGNEKFLSYETIYSTSKKIAANLQQKGIKPGDSVIFQLEDNENIILSFWACILGGFIPTPIGMVPSYTGESAELSKLHNSWLYLNRPVILTETKYHTDLLNLRESWETSELTVYKIDELQKTNAAEGTVVIDSSFVALNLMTSGSTGVPKCVQHHHTSLVAHTKSIQKYFNLTDKDVWLNWMPLDHVGGIVFSHLNSVHLGCNQVIAKIDSFLSSPSVLLDWLDKFRITMTWAPNFAFSLINDHFSELEGNWELSSVRHIINAAENIVPKTTEIFVKNLSKFNLPNNCISPAFGMSETCSGITFSKEYVVNDRETTGFHIISKEGLNETVSSVNRGTKDSVELMELGPPVPGSSIRITNEKNVPIHEGQIGRFQIKSWMTMKGYYQNKKANDEFFLEDGWFNTGDLGFILDGKLTLTGREKDTIIVNGKNFYTYELESIVEGIKGVEVSFAGASAVTTPIHENDQLAVFFSPNYEEINGNLLTDTIMKIKNTLTQQAGITPLYIIPVEKEYFPKTNSGKIRREALVQDLYSGRFNEEIKNIDVLIDNENVLPQWFFKKCLVPKSLHGLKNEYKGGGILAFEDDEGLFNTLDDKLSKLETEIIKVKQGTEFKCINKNEFIINPTNPGDYVRLLNEINIDSIQTLIHMWNYNSHLHISNLKYLREEQRKSINGFLYFAQSLKPYIDKLSIYIASSHVRQIENGIADLSKTPLTGLINGVSQEFNPISLKHIDFSEVDPKKDAENLFKEICEISEEVNISIYYNNQNRHLVALKKVKVSELNNSSFKRQGLYIITGGLGGVGKKLSEYLINKYDANLLIIGKSSLDGPKKKAFLDLVTLAGNKDSIVDYVQDNLLNSIELQEKIDEFMRTTGLDISGIIHLAGSADSINIDYIQDKNIEKAFEAKVYGTYNLFSLHVKYQCLFINTSSVETLFTSNGLSLYAASNAFVENMPPSPNYHCFSWSMWENIGMSMDSNEYKGFFADRGIVPIQHDRALYSLELALLQTNNHLYIGLDSTKKPIFEINAQIDEPEYDCYILYQSASRNFQTKRLVDYINQFITNNETPFFHVKAKSVEGSYDPIDEESREEVVLSYFEKQRKHIPPGTDIEKTLAREWEKALNVYSINVHDSFFHLGGNSLKVTQLVANLKMHYNLDIQMKDIFQHPTISSLAEWIEKNRQLGLPEDVVKQELGTECIEMTENQKYQWIHQKINPNSCAYNVGFNITLKGSLELDLLQQSIQLIFDRHEILRTKFFEENDQYFQEPIDVHTFTFDEIINNAQSGNYEHMINKPFNLMNDKAYRFYLIQGSKELNLIIIFHHIVFDGWSTEVFLRELKANYEGLKQHPNLQGTSTLLSFRDFAFWENKQSFKDGLDYWVKELEGCSEIINFPTTFKRPIIQTFAGNTIQRKISKSHYEKLKELCLQQESTMYMTLLAAYSTLLYRYSQQEDITLGTVYGNRQNKDLEGLLGYFANTLPIRVQVSSDYTFEQLLKNVKKTTLEAHHYQRVPFGKIVERLNIQRDVSYPVLFQMLFGYHEAGLGKRDIDGKDALVEVIDNNESKFDLSMHIYEKDDHLDIHLEYNTTLYSEVYIITLLDHFMMLIDSIIQCPDMQLGRLSIMNSTSSLAIDEMINGVKALPLDVMSIQSVFEEIVRKYPENTALTFDDETITYVQLNKHANRLAHKLREKGIGRNNIVALKLNRSIQLVISILGVLKSGAAYLPIAPDVPEEREIFVLEDSGASLLVTDRTVNTTMKALNIKNILADTTINDYDLEDINQPNDLCYIIYTSGTTGTPKGVSISHANLSSLFFYEGEQLFDFDENDVWTNFHSYSFDFSVWEIFGALLYGGRLVIVHEDTTRDPALLKELLIEEQVTILNQTPTAFYALSPKLKTVERLNIRKIIFGGESLSPVKLKTFHQSHPEIELINMYGITEITIHATYKKLKTEDILQPISNIGRMIPTLKGIVLDENLNRVPKGVLGELYISGPGVSKGYLKKEELTSERFINIKFISDEIYYKTGDIVRLLPNGELEFKGRNDHQIELRGHRIELGEIENKLSQIEGIREVVILPKGESEDNTYLCAYLVADRKMEIHELRELLSKKIPHYMIPSVFIFTEKIPMTINAKVDFKQLPEPEFHHNHDVIHKPMTVEEEKMLLIWKEALRRQDIGLDEDYFVLGGDSIRAISLIQQVKTIFNTEVNVRDLYLNPTTISLLNFIKNTNKVKDNGSIEDSLLELKMDIFQQNPLLLDKVEDVFPMSDIELGMIYHSLKNSDSSLFHDQFVYHLEYVEFDSKSFETAVQIMLEKHPILRGVFNLKDYKVPVQFILKEYDPEVEVHDLQKTDGEDWNNVITNFLKEDLKNPFVLEGSVLWRLKVYLRDGAVSIALVVHHSIMDGWSVATFIKDLINIYSDTRKGLNSNNVQLANSYKEYVKEQLLINESNIHHNFWKKELKDYKRLTLPTAEEGYHAETFELSRDMVEKVHALSNTLKVPNRVIYFTAYLSALNMFSFENDFITGLVESNRPSVKDGESIIGCFLNTVPYRAVVSNNRTWKEWLLENHGRLIDIKEFGKLSLKEISNMFGNETNGENPFFDTMFNFVDFHVYQDISNKEHNTELDMSFMYERSNTKLDFTVSTTKKISLLKISTVYPREFVTSLVQYFYNSLNHLLENSSEMLSKRSILKTKEKAKISSFTQGSRLEIKHETIIHALNETMNLDPERIGIKDLKRTLTVSQIDELSNRIAGNISKTNIEKKIVAIIANRSIDMIIGIIGILKSGRAYLPILPELPPERIDYMLNDSDVGLVLTDEKVSIETEVKTLKLRQLLDSQESWEEIQTTITKADLAYVMYTSGSTGNPKGVMITHGNLIDLLETLENEYPLQENDSFLFKTNFSFDVSVTEIFGWTLGQGCLFVLEQGLEKEPEALIATVAKQQITHINFVPSHLNAIAVNEKRLQSMNNLKYIFSAGEALTVSLARRIRSVLSEVRLENLYGPTEISVYATKHSINEGVPTVVPIGVPLGNMDAYIVNSIGELQPVGVPGELYISGNGVALGYLNLEEMTRDRFVENIFSKNYPTVYKTGDFVKWLPDGTIEYIGRLDDQIKIRGFRIEIDEITKAILKSPLVTQAVVVVKSCPIDSLCAYFVAENVSGEEIKTVLSNTLPEYMIPSFFIRMDELPVTTTGKIDKKNLPLPVITKGEKRVPQSGIETMLLEVWSEFLHVPVNEIDCDASFLSLGGDSIKAIQIVSKVSERGYHLGVNDLLVNQSITEIVNCVRDVEEKSYPQEPLEGVKEHSPIESWALSNEWKFEGYYNQSILIEVKRSLNVERIKRAMAAIVNKHDGLRLNLDKNRRLFYNSKHINPTIQVNTLYLKDNDDINQTIMEDFIPKEGLLFDLNHDLLIKAMRIVKNKQEWLFFMAHHLVIDGVSWRILMDDFSKAYSQDEQGTIIELGAKTASSWEFVRFLEERKEQYIQEYDYWNNALQAASVLPVDAEPKSWEAGDFEMFSFFMSREETGKLLKGISTNMSIKVDEVLIAALTKSLYGYSGRLEHVIEIESHGRNIEGMNLTQTIGWFTSIYPVRLHYNLKDEIQFLSDIKDQLRQVQNNGIGYGVLRYMSELLPTTSITDVRFNYLGSMDTPLEHDLYKNMHFNTTIHEENTMPVKIDINCLMSDGTFEIHFRYNKLAFHAETIRKFGESYMTNLKNIIYALLSTKELVFTASDFDTADISNTDLDSLF